MLLVVSFCRYQLSMNVNAPVSLEEMLALIASGEHAAFRAVYAQAGPKLFAICLRMMKVKDQAEDVFQEAFVKIWERSWQFDPGKGEALAWLASVTRNCALDRLRKAKIPHVPFDETVVEAIDAQATSFSVAWAGESRDLRGCLGQVRENYRNSVVLVYMNGLSYQELACQLGKPVNTVKSWVRRGLMELRECMEG
jgi:RNA polymerase sigma-70 factor, ECF subfamily